MSTVVDICACCQRPWEAVATLSGRPATSVGRADGTACADCLPHLGFSLRSDREHLQLWQALTERQSREHAQEASALRTRITELEQELRSRPERLVDRHVDLNELQAARSEADRAFRSREMAWQALVEIRLLHREEDDGQCRCGLRLDRCRVAQIVDRYPALQRWEKEQIERVRRGEAHALPDGHPALLDRRHAVSRLPEHDPRTPS